MEKVRNAPGSMYGILLFTQMDLLIPKVKVQIPLRMLTHASTNGNVY